MSESENESVSSKSKESHAGKSVKDEDNDDFFQELKLLPGKTRKEVLKEIRAQENNISARKQRQAGRLVKETLEEDSKKIHLPETLLGILKGLYACTLIEIIYVTIMCAYYPHAGMHVIEKYVTTEDRLQYLFYFSTSFLMVGSILLISVKLSPQTILISILLSMVNLIWHVTNVVLYFLIELEEETSLWRAFLYWLEMFPSFLIMDAAIILKMRVNFVAMTEEEIKKIAPKDDKKDIEHLKGALYGFRKPLFNETQTEKNQQQTLTQNKAFGQTGYLTQTGPDVRGFDQNEGIYQDQQEEMRIPHMNYLDQLPPENGRIGSRLDNTMRSTNRPVVPEMNVRNEDARSVASDYYKSRGPRKINSQAQRRQMDKR